MSYRFCPHCGGQLPEERSARASSSPTSPSTVRPAAYSQTAYWKTLLARVDDLQVPPSTEKLVADCVRDARPLFAAQSPEAALPAIIHIVFDRGVVPTGGMLLSSVISTGKILSDRSRLATNGYLFDDDGHVLTVDSVPIGRGYQVLSYWGGAKQYRRWHLTEPALIDPTRRGNPFLMDDNLVAFGTSWADADRLEESIAVLLDLFRDGLPGDHAPCAVPMAIGFARP